MLSNLPLGCKTRLQKEVVSIGVRYVRTQPKGVLMRLYVKPVVIEVIMNAVSLVRGEAYQDGWWYKSLRIPVDRWKYHVLKFFAGSYDSADMPIHESAS